MSVTTKHIPTSDEAMFIAADSVQRVPVSRVFSVFRRRKFLILAVIVAVNVLALFCISLLKPYYNASALVLIETSKSAFNDLQAAISNVTIDTLALRTQADIIQSPAMALRVVDKLDLVHAPEFAEAINPPPSFFSRAQQRVSNWLHLPLSPTRPLTDSEQRQVAAGLLQNKASVGNVGRSYVIEVNVRTGDPELSAAIANAYANFYIALNKDTKQAAITRGTALLDARIVPLRQRVHAAEVAVEEFRERNGMMLSQVGDGTGPQSGTTIASQQLTQVTLQLSEAIANVAQKEASVSAIETANRRGSGIYGITEVVSSPLIQRLREQEGQITARVASLGAVPGADNPILQSTASQLADLRRQINAETLKILDSLRSEAAAARARRDSLQARLSDLQTKVTTQNQAGISLKQLENEADAARKIYREFLSRYEQTSNQLALQEPDASLVSAAQPPLGRTGPPRGAYAVLGVLVSMVLAALFAFLVDRLRGQTVRTSEQLESETGLTPLGMIPDLRGRTASLRLQLRLRASRESLNLLHSILRGGPNRARAPQVVMVTSALAGEGKTWFATSLAGNAGRIGERVLLVDCDQYHQSVAAVLGLQGASEEPANQSDPFLLRREVLPGVDVVTLRQGRPEGWNGMLGLLRAAREHYGLILIDTPPVLLCADAASLASASDGVIIVVRWGATSISKVQAALRTLQAVGAHMLGGMLTQVKVEKLRGTESIETAAYGDYYRQRLYGGS